MWCDARPGSLVIYSRNSPEIKRIRILQTREGRDHTGMFFAEGVRTLVMAVQHNVRIERLIVAP